MDVPSPRRRRSVRFLLYSHDTMGLGHMRRNLLIAQALSRGGKEATVLLVSGSVQASSFAMPPGVDCLTLPALRKSSSGLYDSRRLDVSLAEVINLRSKTMRAAAAAFRPDLLVADNVPRGALGELVPVLEDLGAQGVPCVLGLRDILDEPDVVAREWARAGNEQAIRDYYRAVWVYGDSDLYDVGAEYGFSPEVRDRLWYLGYLDQRPRLTRAATGEPPASPDHVPDGPFALCMVGGGQDGLELADAFTRSRAPSGVRRVVLVGPEMDAGGRRRLHQRAQRDAGLTILDFVTEPGYLVRGAGCLVTMGGYNTVCEALSFRKRALIVPRVRPRLEQLIRAERLRDRGLLDVLHPQALTPDVVGAWMERNFGRRARGHVDLGGLRRLPGVARAVLRRCPRSDRSQFESRAS